MLKVRARLIESASDNVSLDDEGLEMVGNVKRDEELDELIFRQFSQPHINNPSAAAKYIDPLQAEILNTIFSPRWDNLVPIVILAKKKESLLAGLTVYIFDRLTAVLY